MAAFSCKGCPDRTADCHATCEKYNKEKIEHEKLRKEIKDRNCIDIYKTERRFETRSKYIRKYGKSTV